jgi:hypothetical protein
MPQKLDRAQDRRLRLVPTDIGMRSAAVTKNLVLSENFGDGLVRRSDYRAGRSPNRIALAIRAASRARLDAVPRSIGRP